MPRKLFFLFCLTIPICLSLLAGQKYLSLNRSGYLPSPLQWLTSHLPTDFEQIEACYSPDGINFTKKQNVANYFGEQSGLLLPDGQILLTGLDFHHRQGWLIDQQTKQAISDTGFLISKDGWNFERQKLTISGMNPKFWCWGDPVILQLPNGHFRMYLTDRTQEAILVSAYSKNGYDYVFEGPVTNEPGVNTDAVDFTPFYEKKSQQYFIYTRGVDDNHIDVLISQDGRHFEQRKTIQPPFTMQISIIDEGNYYVAYGGHLFTQEPNANLRYPVKAVSTDGLNWTLAEEQPSGPWQGNRTYCGTYAVIKKNDGYYFY